MLTAENTEIKTEEIKVLRRKHCSYLSWCIVIKTFIKKYIYFYENCKALYVQFFDLSNTNNISHTSSHVNKCFSITTFSVVAYCSLG